MLPLPQVIELYTVPSEFAPLRGEPRAVVRAPARSPDDADLLDSAWAALLLEADASVRESH